MTVCFVVKKLLRQYLQFFNTFSHSKFQDP